MAHKRFGAKIKSGLWAGLVARNPKVWLVEHLAQSMSNLASSTSGASVPLATSNDDKYPPEALIDGYVQKACEKHANTLEAPLIFLLL